MLASRAEQPARATREKEVVAITGASGFLGRAIAKRLAGRYALVGLDFIVPDEQPSSIHMVRVDLTSDESVKEAMEKIRLGHGLRIASVIHLAGYYDLSGDPNPKYEQVTVRGTERLLAALRDFEVEQFVFASTMLVHTPTKPGRPIDEDFPIEAKTPYPQSKVDTEKLIAAEHGDMPVVTLRPAGVYDEECRAAFLAQQIANIYERQFESYVYPGDPGSGQPYLHLDDLIDAVVRLIERRSDLPSELTLLLGEPETMGYEELQREIGLLLHGEEWETTQIPEALAKTGQWLQEDVLDEDPFVQPWMIEQASDHYELDITRAKKFLDWEPKHRLRDTLPVMIAALEADPPGWYAKNKLNPATVAAADPVIERAAPKAERRSREALPDVEEMLRKQERQTQWTHMANCAIGLWLIASPFAYGLFDAAPGATPPPAAGMELASAELRNSQLAWSEIASGAAILIFSLVSLQRPRSWVPWATAAVGVWLLFAPLVFWTTSSSAYAADTLLGMLAIVFAVMVPPQPGIDRKALATEADIPLGWSYSPSSYTQRVPIVALAFVGLFISRYLAAFQLGHIDAVWDPFFGGTAENGTETVITSAVSKSFPIADAGFGAVAYALDILTGAVGDRRRWRTMPWLVLIFGLLIIPLGLVSVYFIIIQPTIIGALCTLCLIQTAVTLILIPYSVDEVLATLQYLSHSRHAGRSLWKTLLQGGPAFEEKQEGPEDMASVATVLREFASGGVTYPWTLVASIAIGILLLATPVVASTAPPLYLSDHVAACLAISIAVTALAEVTRAIRFLNVPIGLWVAVSPFLLAGADWTGFALNIVAGLALALLSLPRGKLSDTHYGGWDRMIL